MSKLKPFLLERNKLFTLYALMTKICSKHNLFFSKSLGFFWGFFFLLEINCPMYIISSVFLFVALNFYVYVQRW